MASTKLTVTEREKWISILQKRIRAKIAEQEASAPNLNEELEALARARVLRNLGIEKTVQDIRAACKDMDARIIKLSDDIDAAVRELGAEPAGKAGKYSHHSIYKDHTDVVEYRLEVLEQTLEEATQAMYDELYGAHPVGAAVLALRAELDSVHDTVWLATSPEGLQALWNAYVTRLGLSSTVMEKAAVSQ